MEDKRNYCLTRAYFVCHLPLHFSLPTCVTALIVINIFTLQRENPVTGKIRVTKTATNAVLNLNKAKDLQLID